MLRAMPFDVVGYMYKADVYCPADMLAILLEQRGIEGHGLSYIPEQAIERLGISQLGGSVYEDERNFDSDEFPKVIFRDQLEDTDRCGKCGASLSNSTAKG